MSGAAVPSAAAHPHVWISAQSEIVFAGARIVAVRQAWRFDEGYSAFASLGLDADSDGSLSRSELAPLAKVNVASLEGSGFFTNLRIEDDPQAFGRVQDSWLEHREGRLTLHFTLPLAEPLDVAGRTALLDVFDPAYFVSFALEAEAPVTLAAAPENCRYEVARPAALDPATSARLSAIAPAGEIPAELRNLTAGLSNRVSLACPAPS